MQTNSLAALRKRPEHEESATQTLDTLPMGSSGRLVTVNGDHGTRRRLMEMGLCNGVTIEAVRKAPLGDPIEYRVRGYFISLRADQARCVQISLAS
jgi:ferrous iron transport protein A